MFSRQNIHRATVNIVRPKNKAGEIPKELLREQDFSIFNVLELKSPVNMMKHESKEVAWDTEAELVVIST